jgi:hypothetical protein
MQPGIASWDGLGGSGDAGTANFAVTGNASVGAADQGAKLATKLATMLARPMLNSPSVLTA